jgi:hypothetical protein
MLDPHFTVSHIALQMCPSEMTTYNSMHWKAVKTGSKLPLQHHFNTSTLIKSCHIYLAYILQIDQLNNEDQNDWDNNNNRTRLSVNATTVEQATEVYT